MDANEYNERLSGLVDELIESYAIIGKLFGVLPIPIEIPALWKEDEDYRPDIVAIIQALVRARVILMDLPIDDTLRGLLNKAVVVWLGALDMVGMADMALAKHEPDLFAYRLEVLWLGLLQVSRLTAEATRRL
ncbi:hypothetical protein ACWDRB_61160 [Nonomuraea sp. NPDC003707]